MPDDEVKKEEEEKPEETESEVKEKEKLPEESPVEKPAIEAKEEPKPEEVKREPEKSEEPPAKEAQPQEEKPIPEEIVPESEEIQQEQETKEPDKIEVEEPEKVSPTPEEAKLPEPEEPKQEEKPEEEAPVPDPVKEEPKAEPASDPVPKPKPVPEPEKPTQPPQPFNPSLRLPFNGNYPITFSFGATPDDEGLKQKFKDWGLAGHNGIDYKMPEGTGVVAVDDGKVIKASDGGDFGVIVQLEHFWGMSLYAHLKETKVTQGSEVKSGNPVGLSGQTGTATAPILHFGIKPSSPNTGNGYSGYVDPAPFIKQQPTPQEAPALPEDQQGDKILQLLKRANQERKRRREENLVKVVELAKSNGAINNNDVRELLRISQSTATSYLSALVKAGKLKLEGKGKAVRYTSV